ncbi:MAG TPA: nucleoside triphosphate pyrophosphatase [Steroidobacteraceae bacterium]|nr:nucleoside triphosphate pyrophosphatase [Steroidobacteraceae bacterium]
MFLKSPPSLILASTSIYRRELLARLRLPFSCSAPGVVETPRTGERALALAVRLARAKASAVALQHPDAWVIGSDQVAARVESFGEVILGKPATEAMCVEQLRGCSGQTLSFMTAVAVVQHNGHSAHEFVDTTRVTFRTLDEPAIARYVALEAPLDCAGGFKSEGLGITLCESIDSADPSALIGLPLIRLSAVLRGVGFELP